MWYDCHKSRYFKVVTSVTLKQLLGTFGQNVAICQFSGGARRLLLLFFFVQQSSFTQLDRHTYHTNNTLLSNKTVHQATQTMDILYTMNIVQENKKVKLSLLQALAAYRVARCRGSHMV
jgi:hypothetical protein